MIKEDYDVGPISKCMVHNALSCFARFDRQFMSFGNMYSVTNHDDPFTLDISPTQHEVKWITLIPIITICDR